MNRKECIFIYPEDKTGKRTGHTICVIYRNGKMYFGESLCADTDQFCKQTGRELAFQRALFAYLNIKS